MQKFVILVILLTGCNINTREMDWKIIETKGAKEPSVKIGGSYLFNSMFFINDSIGFLGGDDYYIQLDDEDRTEDIDLVKDAILLKTANSGRTWNRIKGFGKGEVCDIRSVDKTVIVLTQSYFGENAEKVTSHLFMSDDDGQNWAETGRSVNNFRRIRFWSKKDGLAFSEKMSFYNSKEAVFLTRDGGKTWDELKDLPPSGSEGYSVSSNGRLYYLSADRKQYIEANFDNGRVTIEKNGFPISVDPHGITLDNSGNVYLISEDDDRIVAYKSMGENYQIIRFPTEDASVLSVHLFDNSISLFVTDDASDSPKISYFRSDDGGLSWSEEDLPITYKAAPVAYYQSDRVWAWALDGKLQVRE